MVDREHDMRIGTGKQIAAARLDPPVTRLCLAAWAVPITAGNGESPLRALWGVIRYGECNARADDQSGL